MGKFVLVDGNSIMNRAFYGIMGSKMLTTKDGKYTNAVYGFLAILFKLLDDIQPQYMAVAFDLKAPTARHKMYEGYKANRHGMPDELAEQMPIIKEVLRAMNIDIIEMEGYEADDLLGTVARRSEAKGMDVTILSGDRDLLQLATDKVLIRLPKTVRGKTTIENYHTAEVLEKYQVTPPQIIELKALMGDSSDNIPGIPGVGEKTATKMIVQFGSIENAHEHLEEVKPNKAKESLREHYDMAQLSKELATINTDSPLEFSYEKAKVENPYTPEAYELCKRLEFKNMLNRFDPVTAADSSMELEFFTCNDLSGVEALFEKAARKEQVGISVLADPDQVYAVGLVLDEKEIYQIPVGGLLTGDYLCGKLKALADSTVLCAMDIKAVLKHVPLEEPEKVFDTGVAAYLLNPLKSSYTYDDIAREYLDGMMLPAKEDLLGKTSLKKAWEEEMECLGNYACYQAFVPCMARGVLLEKLDETGMRKVYDEIELPLVFTLDSMEKWGISVKGEELKSYGEKLKVRIQELEKTIWQEAGEEFNINSPKQLGVILFEKLQMPNGKKTKTGYSTAADVLEKLAPDYPIVSKILEYRQLTKLKSTYADGLAAFIAEDGRIHSTFQQTITATGRLSSTDPNLQNIPVRTDEGRELRKLFTASEGNVFIDADYSQIELRLMAHFSGCEKLKEAYRNGADIHAITASQVFGVPLEEVTPKMRREAKAVNFGIIYGISAFGLSNDLGISAKEAKAYIDKYFETYSEVKTYIDSNVENAKKDGYVTTLYGRRRVIGELKSSNFAVRSFGERAAMNMPLQGTSADIIKIAMVRVYKRLKDEGLNAKLVLQVHDELVVDCPESEREKVEKILKSEMEHAAELSVPLVADVGTGKSWYEAH